MEFFNEAINVLQTLVIALGAGLGVWGVINLLEGYGNDNPGAKSQGMKQLMAGAGVAVVGLILVWRFGAVWAIRFFCVLRSLRPAALQKLYSRLIKEDA